MRVYPATVVKITDGDTFHMDIDLGFYTTSRQIIRLVSAETPIDTAERSFGASATARVHELMPIGSKVTLHTFKDRADGAFGRWLAVVILADTRDLGATLLREGLATPWKK